MIEIYGFGRHDQYQQVSNYYLIGDNSPYQYSVRGIGTGFGINYKYPVKQNIYLKIGAGYYKHAFDRIQTTHTGLVPRKSMHYLYTGFLTPMNAEQYWANVYTANIGAEYAFPVSPSLRINFGVNLSTYFKRETVIQLEADRRLPNLEQDQIRREGSGYFGQSFYIQAGILKLIGPVGVGPYLMLPVVDSWGMIDRNLAGDGPDVRRQKFLEGIGLGFTLAFAF